MKTNLRYFPLTHFKDDEKLKTKKITTVKMAKKCKQVITTYR